MKEKELFERLLITNMMSKNSSLLFTIEQWELIRRLKNTGIAIEQVCKAFEDLEKIEKDLGHSLQFPISLNTNNETANNISLIDTSSATASSIVNNYFSTIISQFEENKEIEEFKKKGELATQTEISLFVHKHDLKQSQISRMAGVNQAYVSKFLRAEFAEMSENGKILIYKWYLRFLKNPTIYFSAFNLTITSANQSLKTLENSINLIKTEYSPQTSFTNVTNTTYDVSKRTSFRFKPEHLGILERAFIQNQYPDQKKREDLAKLCNLARECSEKEKANEQVVTHWFQNKRKSLRKYSHQGSKASRLDFLNINNDSNRNIEDNYDYSEFIDDNC